jgi:hypothetical protein
VSEVPLPGFAVIAGALRETTERLVREIVSPRAEPPAWNEFEWGVARAVCALHGISALLAPRLLWRGPPDWECFLQDQQRQTLARHVLIGERLAALDRAAAQAGLRYVALKGSALREFSVHHPGERPMGDIDILVRPGDAPLAAQVVESIGYAPAFQARRHDVFEPHERAAASNYYAEHVSSPLRIELHQRVGESLPVTVVDITASLWPADTRAGANPYASLTALLRHLCLHAAGNMRANAMRFLQLYDCALLARRMGESDWRSLLGAEPRDTAWWIYPALAMADRYVPQSIPGGVLAEFAQACPRRLRARFEHCEVSDVSWSNLRIAALPGVEWARSFGEMLRFARKRVFPSREDVDELHRGLHTNPSIEHSRWYRGSQAARIVRWATGRPPRVQTMASVRAALSAGRGGQQ